MLQIKDTLISSEVFEKRFCCDLQKCKGACCVQGDAGAPLNAEEVKLLPKIIDKIKLYLRPEGVKSIDEQGTHVIDAEGETVTPLVNGGECAYVVFSKGIAFCGIEKAFEDGAIDFQKPVSCHLYPLRIRKYEKFMAVNYDTWKICDPACELGNAVKLPVYKFVKTALIRRFGTDWYKHLCIAAEEMEKNNPQS